MRYAITNINYLREINIPYIFFQQIFSHKIIMLYGIRLSLFLQLKTTSVRIIVWEQNSQPFAAKKYVFKGEVTNHFINH